MSYMPTQLFRTAFLKFHPTRGRLIIEKHFAYPACTTGLAYRLLCDYFFLLSIFTSQSFNQRLLILTSTICTPVYIVLVYIRYSQFYKSTHISQVYFHLLCILHLYLLQFVPSIPTLARKNSYNLFYHGLALHWPRLCSNYASTDHVSSANAQNIASCPFMASTHCTLSPLYIVLGLLVSYNHFPNTHQLPSILSQQFLHAQFLMYD
jgi:hypothetical protein